MERESSTSLPAGSGPLTTSQRRTRKRVLDPVERVSEVLFGVIMVLTFTGSLSVAEAGREDVRQMLIGAIGCNIAWGIVDAIMYLMNSMTERARGRLALHMLRQTDRPREAHEQIIEVLPPTIASVLDESEIESIRQRLAVLSDAPFRGRRLVTAEECVGALGVFLLVFLCTFPVVLPFLFMSDAALALRISNSIAILMLYICGHVLGRFAGVRPWLVGMGMVIIGLVLAGLTLLLGG